MVSTKMKQQLVFSHGLTLRDLCITVPKQSQQNKLFQTQRLAFRRRLRLF